MEILQTDGKLSSLTIHAPPPSKGPEIEYEFQDLALQIIQRFKPKYPSVVWAMFHKKEYPLDIIRETWLEYQKYSRVEAYSYFMAMLNRKANVKKK